ncbi:MAG: TolB family protein, partial [Phycisphaerales bacterium]
AASEPKAAPSKPMNAPAGSPVAKAPAAPQAVAAGAYDPFTIDAVLEQQSGRGNGWSTAAFGNAMAAQVALPNGGEKGAIFPSENPSAAIADGMEGLNQLTFAQEGSDFDPQVSRDGQWLVFASTQHRTTPDIYLKRVGSRTVMQLTADPASDVMPAISPDGSRIAFCSNRNGWWNMYVMSTGGGQAVQLSTQTAHELHPSWSPGGSHLVFCRLGQTSGRWELWVMPVAQPQTSEFIGYGMFPEWSPIAAGGEGGSDKILFQRGRERGDRAFSLWTIDFKPGSAGSPTEVVASKGFACINGSWSADASWIVFSSVPSQLTPGRPLAADLHLAAADGSSRVNLTGGKFANVMGTFGGDNRIYFVSDRAGVDNVWSIGTDKAIAAARPSNKGMQAAAPAAEPATAAVEAESQQAPVER